MKQGKSLKLLRDLNKAKRIFNDNLNINKQIKVETHSNEFAYFSK